MSGFRSTLILFVMLISASVVSTISAIAAEPVAEAARSSLKRHAYPWYDAKKDSFRPMSPSKNIEPPTNLSPIELPDFGLGQVIYFLAWTLLAVLISTMVIVLVRSLTIVEFADEQEAPEQPEVTLEALQALPMPETNRGIRDFLAEAERLASQSSYGPAMTYYYSWQLLQLNQQQAIELEKGKTNRQYLNEVQSSMPGLNDLFRQSIQLFEASFFGKLPVSADDFQPVWEHREKFNSSGRRRRT